jgi:hypothetical protein
MAKYIVNFSCGHSEEKHLSGKVSDRERTISYWEQSGTCTECWKKEQEAKRQAAINACKTLPNLTGSEKQIAWAEKIRADKSKMNGFDYIKSESSAKWWIEHRDCCEMEIINRMKQEKENRIKEQATTMSASMIFTRAHQLAKKMKTEYSDTDYRANFAEALRAIYAAIKAVKVSA